MRLIVYSGLGSAHRWILFDNPAGARDRLWSGGAHFGGGILNVLCLHLRAAFLPGQV